MPREHGERGVNELPHGLRLVALTSHARHVSSESRETFASDARTLAADPRAILLHTCHRAELYVIERGTGIRSISLPDLPAGGSRLDDIEALRHILRLAAGLDSVVVGEDQILHQLRDCLGRRHPPPLPRGPGEAGASGAPETLDPVLQRLLQVALRLGREVRSRRQVAPRSLADIAVDRLAARLGSLREQRVLIVGAGSMARSSARSASRHGARVLVANRSPDRAAALARQVGGEAAAFGPSAPAIPADAVLLAIDGRWPLSIEARDALVQGAVPVVDLSSPPALDAVLRSALGQRYTSIDDFALARSDAEHLRAKRRMDDALTEAETSFVRWLQARAAVPTIRALSRQAELRRVEEVDRLFRRADLPEHQRELVEQMSRRLVARLLHDPMTMLREDTEGDLERAARSLFSL